MANVLGIAADAVTVFLGVFAIVGFLLNRKKIDAFMRLLAHTAINERVKRIKGTLGELEALDFNVKEQRKELLAVLGELAGMLKGFAAYHGGFRVAYEELIEITEKSAAMSEPRKRRLCAEIHILLDDQSVAAAVAILEKDNGKQSPGTP